MNINHTLTILYDGPFDMTRFLRDVDIGNISVADIEKVTSRTSGYDIILRRTIGIEPALTLFDKLSMPRIVNDIISLDMARYYPTMYIINHEFRGNGVIGAYLRGYKVVYNNIVDARDDLNNGVRNAFCNGIHVIKLDASGTRGKIRDIDLEACTHIMDLCAHNNHRITTCEPFAGHIRRLVASGTCGINDAGLSYCTRIEYLDASDNPNISICGSSHKAIRTLFARGTCNIGDTALYICPFITTLDASNNPKITTCEPFAAMLRALFADGICGISDAGISSCTDINTISARNNPKISHDMVRKLTRVNTSSESVSHSHTPFPPRNTFGAFNTFSAHGIQYR